jgi:glucose-1-phosphate thymidylyltransferase
MGGCGGRGSKLKGRKNMKGVLLCGGEGTRLKPLTDVVNKHLIRIVDRPMAQYPLEKMIECGIREFLIVTGGENFAGIVKYFGSGHKWGVSIHYAIQDKAGGIAEALGLAKSFTGQDNIMVVLGDNFWTGDISHIVDHFDSGLSGGCALFAITVKCPEHYGVFIYENAIAVDMIEKPKGQAPSNKAATGIYIYGPDVFSVIDQIKPSDRGEREITDVNRFYLNRGLADVHYLPGPWYDCGQFETLLAAEQRILNDRSV